WGDSGDLAMGKLKPQQPTELELKILKILWGESPLTASEIRNRLAKNGRDLAHTSVITTLQKMVQKLHLKQLVPVEGKSLRFIPVLTDQFVAKGMLGELVDRVFDGSVEAVAQSLFKEAELDEDAIKRLRRLLDQKLKEQKK
ncbi:MAG: BlaI/MecI/CopY family transcriptional regulator, partial [Pirellula sp.]|nr:BlaI/MecI/CopY family transcriptional regulator [Pirellula sp.]